MASHQGHTWSYAAHSQGLDSACSGAVLGRFYLFGGGVFGGAGVNTTQIYDPTANRWMSGTPMRGVNADATGVIHGDGNYNLVAVDQPERYTGYVSGAIGFS